MGSAQEDYVQLTKHQSCRKFHICRKGNLPSLPCRPSFLDFTNLLFFSFFFLLLAIIFHYLFTVFLIKISRYSTINPSTSALFQFSFFFQILSYSLIPQIRFFFILSTHAQLPFSFCSFTSKFFSLFHFLYLNFASFSFCALHGFFLSISLFMHSFTNPPLLSCSLRILFFSLISTSPFSPFPFTWVWISVFPP